MSAVLFATCNIINKVLGEAFIEGNGSYLLLVWLVLANKIDHRPFQLKFDPMKFNCLHIS